MKQSVVLFVFSLFVTMIYSQNLHNEHLGRIKNDDFDQKSDNLPKFNKQTSGKITLDSIIISSWDETIGDLIKERLAEFYYDSKGNMISHRHLRRYSGSNILRESYKYNYSYDSNNRIIQALRYDWDEDESQLIFSWKTDNTFDSSGNLIHIINSDWYKASSEWVFTGKREYSYNTNNNLTEELELSWNSTNETFVQYRKTEYSYNDSNQLIEEIVSSWSTNQNQWKLQQKISYTYNSNGKILQIISHVANYVDEWIYSHMHEYIYNEEDKLIQYLESNWNSSLEDWLSSYKVDYEYNESGFKILEISYNWDTDNHIWIGSWKGELDYDSFGNIIQIIEYEWIEEWVGIRKLTSLMDDYGCYHIINSYYWNEDEDNWVKENYSERTYDYTYAYEDIILPYNVLEDDDTSFFKYAITDNTLFYNRNDTWLPTHWAYHYSSHEATSIDNSVNEKQLNIFPNPTTGFVVIENENLSLESSFYLYDMQGKLVYYKKLSNNQSVISLHHLESGMYVCKVYDGERYFAGRLIKR